MPAVVVIVVVVVVDSAEVAAATEVVAVDVAVTAAVAVADPCEAHPAAGAADQLLIKRLFFHRLKPYHLAKESFTAIQVYFLDPFHKYHVSSSMRFSP